MVGYDSCATNGHGLEQHNTMDYRCLRNRLLQTAAHTVDAGTNKTMARQDSNERYLRR